VDPDGNEIAKYDLAAFQTLFMAGERLDPETYHWAREKLGVPVIDHWWQTETGWAIAANLHGLERMPVKAGSATMPVPGWDVQNPGRVRRAAPGRPGGRDRDQAAAAAGFAAHALG